MQHAKQTDKEWQKRSKVVEQGEGGEAERQLDIDMYMQAISATSQSPSILFVFFCIQINGAPAVAAVLFMLLCS